MGGGHDFTRAEQELLGRAVAARKADRNKDPLSLRVAYASGRGVVKPCPQCDEFFR